MRTQNKNKKRMKKSYTVAGASILLLVAYGVSALAGNVNQTINAIQSKKGYHVRGQHYFIVKDASQYKKQGIGSWYGKGDGTDGKPTANGESFNTNAMTAASKELPIGSKVRVKNLDNNKSVVVRINDRGPFVGGRIIDLSYAGAKALGYADKGVAHVEVTAIA